MAALTYVLHVYMCMYIVIRVWSSCLGLFFVLFSYIWTLTCIDINVVKWVSFWNKVFRIINIFAYIILQAFSWFLEIKSLLFPLDCLAVCNDYIHGAFFLLYHLMVIKVQGVYMSPYTLSSIGIINNVYLQDLAREYYMFKMPCYNKTKRKLCFT